MMESVSTFIIGSLICTLIKDFNFNYKIADYFSNVSSSKAISALKKYGIQSDPIPSPYVALVVESSDKKILIDTGLGHRKEPLAFGGRKFKFDGSLIPFLAKEKMLEEIDYVVLTHLHPDHAAGLFTDGQFNFPKAQIVVHEEEWEYWTKKYILGSSPVFDYTVREQVMPLKDQNLELIRSDEFSLTDEINLIKVPGHTPGQLAVHLTSGGEDLLYVSDTWLHPLHIEHLDWETAYDLDHVQAKKSRIKMLELAHSEKMLVQSFHFDFPGLGHVVKGKGGWKWVPIS